MKPQQYRYSAAELAQRRAACPKPQYPEELPVSARRADIAQAIARHQVVIVCGETGSGKTTQLPKILLELGRGVNGFIGHTQPRRIAARATAARIAQELKTELGSAVGYKIRFNDKVGPRCYIKLMTDGILLAETQGDRDLRQYDAIIIDEAHERSLNIDFLLGYFKQLLARRPDLKLVVTSATIDAERFSRHFDAAPVIEVSGRLYPVELRYWPRAAGKTAGAAAPRAGVNEAPDLADAIVDAVDEAARCGPGDVLVFLPGEREIRETAEALRKHHPPTHRETREILPLYARLSAAEQERVFKPHAGRRIVLATNVAETSLTVPGIRYVVDPGEARIKRYSYRSKVEQLQVEKISQASANQRAGRCGRVASGVCIRLYGEDEFTARPAYTEPEVLRSSLAGVILRMKSLHLGEVEDFPFLDPPLPKAVSDGYGLLSELGAVDEANDLTEIGRQLARLPLDPCIGRMILAAKQEGSLAEVLIIAAVLSLQDPRERPLERAGAADAAQLKFDDEKSDFLSWLKLWKFYQEALAHKKSNRKLMDLCRDNFLSYKRMREWLDIHSQLHTSVAELGWKVSEKEATYAQIHRALLAGLLGNVGCKSEDSEHYLGARGIKFLIHPGSGVGKKAGRWIMAAEITETTRLYARCIARIEPEWLEGIGAHLVRRHQYEPHWEKQPARVAAFERATLYGILLYAKRRIHYGPLDPDESRRIFIRQALVEGEYETRAPFFQHNRKLIADIEKLEHKSRRPDVLVDEELIYAFYDSLVPEGIHNGAAFEHWRREAEAGKPKLLYLKREDLMRHEAAGITTALFPHQLEIGGRNYALEYLHDPGNARDGLTLTVPLIALNQLAATRCDWLVPGLQKEKVALLAKTLPQKIRHKLGPLPEFAEQFVAAMASAEPQRQEDLALVEAIARYAREELNLALPPDGFRPELLPAHLSMNFRVVDEHGRQLAMGRNLAQLRAELGEQAGAQFSAIAQPKAALSGITSWDFGELREIMEIRQGAQTLIGYPALVDRGDSVDLEVLDTPQKARELHRDGLRRLFMLQLKEQTRYLERNLPGLRDLGMQFLAFGDAASLKDQLLRVSFDRACMAEPLPTMQAEFLRRCDEGKTRLALLAQEICRLAGSILTEYQALQKKLQGLKNFPQPAREIEEQLARLLPKDFIAATAWERLQQFPRYLRAVALRLAKLRADPARDARASAEFNPLWQLWLREDLKQRKQGVADAQLAQYRWLLEELRVSLYAQELRTPVPVSVKRLQKMWQAMQR
ncbi:MAG: ATP-dependent RNA helicase HrpA [Betaproteobacteria bacterium RIFCSPLOWO2_12_FULL_64_23]|nr:MAG: ATP-dependent RNA helicase HrpA [Betaproteobacteria bacterium RIFCSPLOWO2_12_FULL_64_23]